MAISIEPKIHGLNSRSVSLLTSDLNCGTLLYICYQDDTRSSQIPVVSHSNITLSYPLLT